MTLQNILLLLLLPCYALVHTFMITIYSSNLWDFISPEAETETGMGLYKAARSYLVQEVLACGKDLMKTRLLLKFNGLHDILMSSPSKEARSINQI